MGNAKFTDEELDQLTEEERAGLEEDIDEGDEPTADGEAEEKAAAAGLDGAAEAAAQPEAAQPDEEPGQQAEAPAAAAEAPPAPAKPEQSAQKPLPAEPDAEAELKTAKDRLGQIETELAELAAKFDDGELTAAEMHEQQRQLNQESVDLRVDIRMQERQQQDARRQEKLLSEKWGEETAPAWLGAHPEYKAGTPMFHALNGMLRELQGEAMAAGRTQYDVALIDEAHRRIQEAMGRPAAPAAATRKPAREIPPTLAHTPAAAATPTDDGNRFAHLDRLAGEAYEDALARLSDADREAYLAQ